MPELPDLQAFSRNLNKLLSGKTVQEVNVPNSKKLNVPVKELQTILNGQKVERVYREGKELHIAFNKGDVLGLHLMLHGKLHVFEEKHAEKNAIIELNFTDGSGLLLTDFQGIAAPTLNPEKKRAEDALSDKIDFNFLKEKLQGTRSAVKNVLLDQHIIRGIGNAYADEILWDARISPLSAANKIPDDKIRDLAKSIKIVLLHAEEQILKSKPDIISGEVRDFLKIHNAKKKQSPTGAEIKVETGSRKTYYTDEQVLYGK